MELPCSVFAEQNSIAPWQFLVNLISYWLVSSYFTTILKVNFNINHSVYKLRDSHNKVIEKSHFNYSNPNEIKPEIYSSFIPSRWGYQDKEDIKSWKEQRDVCNENIMVAIKTVHPFKCLDFMDGSLKGFEQIKSQLNSN